MGGTNKVVPAAAAAAPTFTALGKHFAGRVGEVPYGKALYTLWGSYFIWLAMRKKRKRQSAGLSLTAEEKANRKIKAKRDNKSFSALIQLLMKKLQGSKHGIYFGAYIFSLVSRVFITVKLADIGGVNAGDFGSRNWDAMFAGQAEFGMWCGVGAAASGLIKYLEKRVALSVREILYKHLTDKYFDKALIPYYRGKNSDPQSRLTADLDAYSTQVVHLLGYFLKPAIDVTYLAYVMGNRIGGRSLAIFMLYFLFSSKSLQRIKDSLPTSLKDCAMRTQELEGELRNRHQKIHDFKEQIAMQKGTEVEKKSITKCFNQLANHVDATNQQYVVLDTVTTYVMKYGGAMVGFSVLIPREYLADPNVEPRSVAAVTQGFISNSALLGSLANAMKDLADSFIEVPKVAGLASRVYDLLESFHDVPEMINKAKTTSEEQVKIVNVTLHAPGENGKLLVKDLNAVIEPRQHTILKGPNGAGKSSIFRTLSGLWEADESDGIFLPEKTFFMPQDCYFPVGNLTAQVTYPMEPSTNGSDAATISSLLTTVGLAELLDYGLDTVKDWNKILSGGQKQRMAWARMFFLKPQFAFIDEGTSAVSHEVIDTLYSTAKNDFNITVVSIAHQESLEAYHGHTIELLADGNGGYVLTSPPAKEKSSDVNATTQI